MRGQGTLQQRTVTEADVIAWLRADFRLRTAFDPEVVGGVELTQQTTIADWREAFDLVGTKPLARVMNDWFGCDRPVEEWRGVLEPEQSKTLGDLARFAAAHMELADFTPFGIAGHRDAASGAFFALRHLLAQDGHHIRDFRPSTSITGLTEREVVALSLAVAKLAPDVTPEPVIVPRRRQQVGILAGLLGSAGLLGGVLGTWPIGAWAGAAAILTGVVMARGQPERVEFGTFRTVGEVAKAIAATRQVAA